MVRSAGEAIDVGLEINHATSNMQFTHHVLAQLKLRQGSDEWTKTFGDGLAELDLKVVQSRCQLAACVSSIYGAGLNKDKLFHKSLRTASTSSWHACYR